jgi:two-component system sensor histidine kinase RegB
VTGGLNNPFCLMLVAPATIAAANLPTRFGMAVVGTCMAAGVVLAFWSLDLPWIAGEAFMLPDMYRIGMLVALLIGIVFTAGYAWRASLESARMEQALAATQAVLEKEHRMSALGGLAAAAAHELGTPLGTIQVVAKEMLHALKRDNPLYEDAELLVSQSQRCRDILKNLSARPEQSDAVFNETTLHDFLESVVAPYRGGGKRIEIAITAYDAPGGVDPGKALMIRRRPEWLHALSAFVENASDFARSTVKVRVQVTKAYVSLAIEDDGPGFAPDILSRLGEPYISSRVYGASWSGEGEKPSGQSHSGMGLGFFIAKTLCEHTGAKVTFGNREEGGAYVKALWRRDQIDILYA